MELDVLIMPTLAKMEFSVHPDYWKDELIRVKKFFISNEIYTTGPIIFTREVTGMDEMSFVTYMVLNDEIDDIPELNIKYEPLLELLPTISHKCFDDDDFDQVYEDIKQHALDKELTLSDKPFYHVMVDYFGGQVYEIHAEIDMDGVDME